MKTTLKKLLCIILAISCVPVFGCSNNKDSPADVNSSVSESVADSADENSESDDEDVGETTTTTTKKTTTTRATTTTTTTTTTPDVTVTDEGGEVVTGTDGKPIYVTTITDEDGETIAVTTVTDEDGETVTDTDGKIVTATVALTTTVVTTTTTAPTTTTTTKAQTVATTTTAKPVVTTTKATTTAKPVTTTAPTTMASGVASTVVMAEGEAITVYYYDEKPENATLQAYSDLAEYGILTDEIRELITADVMNYASTKYGCTHNTELYANSPTDYNSSFAGGAKNNGFSMGFDTVAHMIKWGTMSADYIQPSLNDNAKRFQTKMYGWVDYTVQIEGIEGYGCNVGFCLFETDESGYGLYQVSFIY